MALHISLCLFLAFFIASLCSSHASTFNVGGKDGWTLHPSENYNQWSSRLRFLLNDTLHFKYNGGSDSVVVVNKADYDNCNANNPVARLDGGDSFYKFNRTGPFYFITGNKSNCDQGQKLAVVVISPRNKTPPPAAAPPSPASFPPAPAASPVSPSPQSGTGTGIPITTSPASSPGGGAITSPVGSPGDVNARPPMTSSSPVTQPLTGTSTVAIMIFVLGWLF